MTGPHPDTDPAALHTAGPDDTRRAVRHVHGAIACLRRGDALGTFGHVAGILRAIVEAART